MAISRCPRHKPTGRTRAYVAALEPVGYPDTAIICGSKECLEPGLVWCEAHEKSAYDAGERVLQAFTATMKFKVK